MTQECGCAYVALRALVRLERLDGATVPLDASLELAERAEADCQMLLQCETCRQRSLALFSATALSTCVLDWLRRSWQLDSCGEADHRPPQIALGDYNLDPADAETLSRELMALRLSHIANVMTSLRATISTLGAVPAQACLGVVQANLQQLRDYIHRVRIVSSASN
ncbi:hypothetical protein MPH_00014 [Macrophomina phaseolina MS6]|uniref:Uncharacterized protein n=1 Tax=Macrophomina phaseolina (strain MS6) TaxID=1126212 RepID=K2T131_MACPH|nr:hypothetical protein MPH_00014 [Macrophomina phaseolina MS6]